MFKNYLYLLGLLMLLVFSNCKKEVDEYKENLEKEEVKIQEFLDRNGLDIEPNASGLYILSNDSHGLPVSLFPTASDYVIMEYSVLLIDSTWVETTDSIKAKANNIYNEKFLYGPAKFRVGYLIPGMHELLSLMAPGGTSTALVPFDLGYGKIEVAEVPYATLLIELRVLEIIIDPVQHEKMQIDTFMAKHPGFDTLRDGLYYQKIADGNGKKILYDSELTYYNSVTLLDRRVLEEKEHKRINGSHTVMGMNIGLNTMEEDEKGIFIIRSDLAYGDGRDSYGRILFPPYCTLHIYVHMKKVD